MAGDTGEEGAPAVPGRVTSGRVAELRESPGFLAPLALVLFVSGSIEGFVTPSGLPTWARIAIGAAAETAFLLYVYVSGCRAARWGESGDLADTGRSAAAPVAA